jgi:hypothetical protein
VEAELICFAVQYQWWQVVRALLRMEGGCINHRDKVTFCKRPISFDLKDYEQVEGYTFLMRVIQQRHLADRNILSYLIKVFDTHLDAQNNVYINAQW